MGNSPSRPNELHNNNNLGQSAHSIINDDDNNNGNGLDDPDDSRKKQQINSKKKIINNSNINKKRKNSLDNNNYQSRKSTLTEKTTLNKPKNVNKNDKDDGDDEHFDFEMEIEIAKAFTNDVNPLVKKGSRVSSNSNGASNSSLTTAKLRTESTGTMGSKNSVKTATTSSYGSASVDSFSPTTQNSDFKTKPNLFNDNINFDKVGNLSEIKTNPLTTHHSGNETSDYRLNFTSLSDISRTPPSALKTEKVIGNSKKKSLTVQNKTAHDSLQKPNHHIPTPLASLATSSSVSSESTTANGGSGVTNGTTVSSSQDNKSNSRTTNINLISQQGKMSKNSGKVLNIDDCITRLKEIADKNIYHKILPFEKWEIQLICMKAREVFLSQPSLLKLKAPIKVVGDVHGQFNDLLRILKLSGDPSKVGYLFLGDYVDRGKQSLETILLLLLYKIKYPQTFFMLRGNHESSQVTKIYGFYDECKRRCGTSKVWKYFVDCFNSLPFAGIINDKIFCVHGGISPFLQDMKQIDKILRPTDIPQDGLLTDLLWSDPEKTILDWQPNTDRGVSCYFSKKNVSHFCKKFQFDLIIRGHMVVEEGYEFFGKKRLVTIFSAPNYCGEFNNWGAVMDVDKDLICSFELLKPRRSDK